MIDADKLRTILPQALDRADIYAPIINRAADEFGIAVGRELAMFVAQIGHESGHLRHIEENLNYTNAQRLVDIFGKRFAGPADAAAFAGQPARIANRVYANRLGNGNEASGDGWRYRGRGLIQITGCANYARCSLSLYKNADVLLNAPDKLCEPEQATRSAAWFWSANGCGDPAARGDVSAVTKLINGPAREGLAARDALYRQAVRVLGA